VRLMADPTYKWRLSKVALRLTNRQTDRTADPGSTEPAIARGIFREILLVIILGVVERAGRQDLRRDAAVSGFGEPLLLHIARSLRRAALIVVIEVDAGAILCADVVPLTHPLRGIVILPEHLQQILVSNHSRIEDDEDDLGMAGHSRAHLAIRGVR